MMEINEELLEADAEGIKNLGIDVRLVFSYNIKLEFSRGTIKEWFYPQKI